MLERDGRRVRVTAAGRALAERHPRHRVRLAETETAASIAAVVAGEVDPQRDQAVLDPAARSRPWVCIGRRMHHQRRP